MEERKKELIGKSKGKQEKDNKSKKKDQEEQRKKNRAERGSATHHLAQDEVGF